MDLTEGMLNGLLWALMARTPKSLEFLAAVLQTPRGPRRLREAALIASERLTSRPGRPTGGDGNRLCPFDRHERARIHAMLDDAEALPTIRQVIEAANATLSLGWPMEQYCHRGRRDLAAVAWREIRALPREERSRRIHALADFVARAAGDPAPKVEQEEGD
ncbi:MAG: hypothetical protein BIFFINMI_03176 [Phycisphaerae bacterium]|nr:hypothetical protein [Phycisphaerae bacterium]